MKQYLKYSICLVLMFGLNLKLNAKIIMAPYLQAITANSAIIMVESDSEKSIIAKVTNDKNVTIDYSTTFTKKTTNETYVHRIVVENLKSSTHLYYSIKVSDDNITYTGDFNTFPIIQSDFRFACFGDSRSAPKIFEKVVNNIIPLRPEFSILTGDICFDGSYKLWKEEFFIAPMLELASNSSFYNALGNHEGWSNNTQAFQQSPNTGKENKSYYSFEYGDVLFLMLSTEHNVKKGSEQWNFAETILKNTKKKWKVVAYHNHAYCGGGHGENKDMIAMSKSLFVPYKVDLVVNGHSHFYQRNEVDGIPNLILAGGGAPLYKSEDKPYTKVSAKTHHFGIFDVNDKSIKVSVYDLNKNIIDKFEISK